MHANVVFSARYLMARRGVQFWTGFAAQKIIRIKNPECLSHFWGGMAVA